MPAVAQDAGRDDRQLLFLPPGSSPPPVLHDARASAVFPNVPYEENKGR